ncbi:MAG TPA: cation:proton antiporter, partial [Methanothrix sp.]|nr:cation:proton antiporter [Methanothrix sp.]
LYQIAKTQDRELFLLSIVAICFAVAWMSSQAGLSLGLGAFLAGLTISESPYSHQAFGNILPLRDAFTSFFFISIGMLLDVNYLMQNPGYIILIAIGVMLLKAVIAGFTISFMGLPLRMAVLVGLALSQIGEFSFILSKVGYDCGLVSQEIYQLFLDVAVLTMGATSFLMASSQKLADGLLLLPLPERLKNRSHALSTAPSKSWRDHLIIVGYGVNGRNVARSAKAKGIPFVIVEMDPEIVSYEGKIGEPIYYGDATQENVLRHVNVREARVMVIAISDPEATRRIVEVARRLNFDLFIIARTRYLDEMLPLHNLGANEVIPEEYETSVEIFSRVLKQYDVPRDQIESFIQEVRSDGYEMFRSLSPEPYCDANVDLITDEIGTFRVCSGSPICGRPVADIELERHATKMLAIHRDMKTIANPDESFILKVDDVAILMGPEESLSVLGNLFHSPMMK